MKLGLVVGGIAISDGRKGDDGTIILALRLDTMAGKAQEARELASVK